MSSTAPGGGGDPPYPPPSLHRRHRRRGSAPPRPPSLPPSSFSSCPPLPESGEGATDVFVTARTDFRAQLRRCQRLLAPTGGAAASPRGAPSAGGPPKFAGPPRGELRLHGLGLAVPRAINLALQLQAGAPGTLRLHASTSSVALPAPQSAAAPPKKSARPPPEEEEEDEGEEGGTPRPRHNSAIHIRVCREAPCA